MTKRTLPLEVFRGRTAMAILQELLKFAGIPTASITIQAKSRNEAGAKVDDREVGAVVIKGQDVTIVDAPGYSILDRAVTGQVPRRPRGGGARKRARRARLDAREEEKRRKGDEQ